MFEKPRGDGWYPRIYKVAARSPDFQTLFPLWKGLLGTFPPIMTIGLGELSLTSYLLEESFKIEIVFYFLEIMK